jgi:tetratricopeptide (TPR) repeat protein
LKNKDIPQATLSAQQPFPGYIWAIIVAAVGFLLYINTVANGYVLDDNYAIQKNLYVQDGFGGIPKIFTVDFWYFANLKLGYYRPLSLITFAIEHEFFGNSPGVSHFDNAVLYGVTGFMLCLFLIRLLPTCHPAFAFFTGLLFITHPIHTEVVANIKSRDEILSFLNLITMSYFAFRYIDTKKKKHLVWSMVFFYLALLSKETAFVGVVLLPLFFYHSGLTITGSLKKMVPYAMVAILFFVQKNYFLGSLSTIVTHDIVNYPYAASAVKLPTAFHIFELCLQKLVFPWPLRYNYCYNQVPASHWSDGGPVFGLILFLVLAYFTFKELRKRSVPGLGLSIIFITLVPSLAFVFLKGGVMAERFLYAPCLGFALLIVYALSMIKAKQFDEKASIFAMAAKNGIMMGTVIFLSVVYSFETIARNTAWKDELTLYATDAKYLAQNCQLHLHYGTVLLENGANEKDSAKRRQEFSQGIDELHKAIAIQPTYSDVYYQLGFGYQLVEVNLDSAITNYKRAIDINQGYAMAYINLGVLYSSAGKLKLASYYFNKAAEVNPLQPEGPQYAADLKKRAGLDIHEFPGDEATVPLQTATPKPTQPLINIDPGQAKEFDADEKKGAEAVQKGDYAAAIKFFKKAAVIQADNRQNLIYLANSYGMAKRFPESVKTFELILKQDPDNQLVIKNLAQTYEAMGQKAKAEELRKRLR